MFLELVHCKYSWTQRGSRSVRGARTEPVASSFMVRNKSLRKAGGESTDTNRPDGLNELDVAVWLFDIMTNKVVTLDHDVMLDHHKVWNVQVPTLKGLNSNNANKLQKIVTPIKKLLGFWCDWEGVHF